MQIFQKKVVVPFDSKDDRMKKKNLCDWLPIDPFTAEIGHSDLKVRELLIQFFCCHFFPNPPDFWCMLNCCFVYTGPICMSVLNH